MISFAQRSTQSEIMDDDQISYEEFAQTLRQIAIINRIVGAYRPTLGALEYFLKKHHKDKQEPLRILDIGCGFGDMLRKIHVWANAHNVNVELAGVDYSPWSKQAALAHTPEKMQIAYHTADIFTFKNDKKFDVIINSLFTHHLSDENIVGVLKWMCDNTCYGFFINDLHRHALPYNFIKTFVHTFPFNRLIRNDAPLSVARSFTRKEWLEYARSAHLNPNRLNVTWHWPFRWGVRYDI